MSSDWIYPLMFDQPVWSTIEFAQPAMLNLGILHSIDDFADAIIAIRAQEASFGNEELMAPISELALKNLLQLAYYASETHDESRFPAFRLVMDANDRRRNLTVTFTEPIELADVQPLRRLAHACTATDHAVLVSDASPFQEPTRLVCPGFIRLQRDLTHTFRIWVKGPGHLVAGDSIWQFELHAGHIRSIAPLSMISAFSHLTHELAFIVDGKVPPPPNSESSAETMPDSDVVRMIEDMIFLILRQMTAKRHGGAIVVLPSGVTDPNAIGVVCKYPARGIDLLRVIKARAKREMACKSVADLSAVDGCLVLTRDLKLVGFGGEICVADADARASPHKFTRLSGEIFEQDGDYDAIMNSFGGMRHRSAARLCRVVQGILVFLVSQDSDLKLICNRDNGVFPYGPLDPRRMGEPPE